MNESVVNNDIDDDDCCDDANDERDSDPLDTEYVDQGQKPYGRAV